MELGKAKVEWLPILEERPWVSLLVRIGYSELQRVGPTWLGGYRAEALGSRGGQAREPYKVKGPEVRHVQGRGCKVLRP